MKKHKPTAWMILPIAIILLTFFIACEKYGDQSPTAVGTSDESQALTKSTLPACLSKRPDIIVSATSDVVDFGGAQQISDLPGPDGVVSLREAITAANNTTGPNVIGFNIPTNDPGFDGSVFTISGWMRSRTRSPATSSRASLPMVGSLLK